VNLGPINFVGTRSCTINRSDVAYDEAVALQQWIQAKQGTAPSEDAARDERATTPQQVEVPPIEPVEQLITTTRDNPHTLRHLLTADLAQRLNLAADALQIDFKPQDEPLLNLAEPQFRFQIEPLRVRNLGQVMWTVHLLAAAESQKVTVTAHARAWQNQLLVQQPLAHRQIIRDEDIIERRALVEQLSDDPLLERHQVVGQQAARELKPGALFTSRMVDPVPLVRSGQFVTISLIKGSVRVKTVARALEGGSYGQSIRVRNEATREIFEVTLTGPQTATFGGTHATAAVDMADAISR